MRRNFVKAVLGTAVAVAFGTPALAQSQEVRIGVIYPLTGPSASVGGELKNALEMAADIINNGAKIRDLPFAAGGGLPGLKGAKIKLIFADHQGNPQVGATEAERLITQEKVVAIVGSYNSAVTLTASQVAERYKIPFLNPESSSASLTARGFKYFFRTTPHDDLFVHNAFDFLKELQEKNKNIKIGNIATFNENGLWGTETTKLQAKLAPEKGFTITKQILYPAKTTQLTSEVQTLKASSPSLVMQSSYTPDAILSMKTYKELGFSPDMILANNAGFTDTEFIKTLGKDAEYVITREVWALDLANRNPLIKEVNELFQSRYKINFTGNSSRTFTGLMVMADAINRAKSTDAEAIRKALSETNITADHLIMPWKGVKFDEHGQNVLGRGILVQIIGGKYNTVWPFEMASREVTWPMPKWDARKAP